MYIAITTENAQLLVNYLVTKPYNESAGLIQMLQSAPGLTPDNAPTAEPDPPVEEIVDEGNEDLLELQSHAVSA